MDEKFQEEAPTYAVAPVRSEAPPEPARIGPLGRLIGVLVSPGETFEDINRKPTWLVPMIITILLGIGVALFYNWWAKPNYDAIVHKQLETYLDRTGGQMPPEDVVAKQARIRKTADVIAPAIIRVPIFFLVSGLFAVGLMLLGAKATFMKILSVYVWTSCAIGLLASIVLCVIVVVHDRDTLSGMSYVEAFQLLPTNPGILFHGSETPVLKSLAGSLDLFSLWTILLLTMGFAAISGSKKISRYSIAGVIVVLWIVYVLLVAGLASLGFGGS
jgi:hypothetical protein